VIRQATPDFQSDDEEEVEQTFEELVENMGSPIKDV